MKFNPKIHHRHSIRLQGYDYSNSGAYFITIVSHNRECLFGNIVDEKMILNENGKIVETTWNDLPNHNDNISLDEFVIMPNHIHGIIVINKNNTIANNESKNYNITKSEMKNNIVGAGSKPAPTNHQHGLPEIVRQLKTFSAKRINQIRNMPGISVWQRNYYEHIIRNNDELNRIRKYIIDNPLKWKLDKNYL